MPLALWCRAFVAAAAGILPTTAFAGDWSGFYAGVLAGVGAGNVNYDVVGSPMTFDLTSNGLLAGVALGGNAQFGSVVVGVETDLSLTGMTGGPKAIPPTMTKASNSIDWIAAAKMRAGLVTELGLLYATAGVAIAQVSSTSNFPSAFAAKHTGWTIGAGAEVMISEQMSVKAEYSAFNFGAINDGSVYNGGAGNSVDILPTMQTATVGLNFHF